MTIDLFKIPHKIPPENREITVDADIFFVNILLLITTIAQHIVFNAMQHILHRHVKTILSAVIGQKLNQDYGFKLVRLNLDSKFFNVATNYQHYD